MFCWWQDCPPTMEGPCRDRGPFTPCSVPSSRAPPPPEPSTVDSDTENITDSTFFDSNTTEEAPTTKQQPSRFCLVMGHRYEVGDKLPHDTGNCLECVCAVGAKVTCSPHQCSPAGEEINDYRPPGPRQPDVF